MKDPWPGEEDDTSTYMSTQANGITRSAPSLLPELRRLTKTQPPPLTFHREKRRTYPPDLVARFDGSIIVEVGQEAGHPYHPPQAGLVSCSIKQKKIRNVFCKRFIDTTCMHVCTLHSTSPEIRKERFHK
jgi:hypothetical protein